MFVESWDKLKGVKNFDTKNKKGESFFFYGTFGMKMWQNVLANLVICSISLRLFMTICDQKIRPVFVLLYPSWPWFKNTIKTLRIFPDICNKQAPTKIGPCFGLFLWHFHTIVFSLCMVRKESKPGIMRFGIVGLYFFMQLSNIDSGLMGPIL